MLEIPRLPPEMDGTVNLARLLMGGDRSNSAFSVFVDRCMMFCSQPLYPDEERYWGMFYERLRNPFEVVVALAVGSAINQQAVPFEHGLLVRVGVKMFPSFYDAPQGRVPMPEADEQCVGNHSVTLTGVDPGPRFAFHHLFSPDWGQDGFGSLPFDYLAELAVESSVFRSHGGPEPEQTEDAPPDAETASRHSREPVSEGLELPQANRVRLGRLEREYSTGSKESPWALAHLDDKVIWTGRRIIGAGNGDVWIQAALLLRGIIERPLLVGWMSGRIIDDQLIDIEEFFIWPPYRGHGLGTALAGRTLLYAAATDVTRVRWLELEADAFVNTRVSTHVPSWLRTVNWNQPDEDAGWGVRRISTEMQVEPLLRHLADLHKEGGVHLIWTDGVVTVADHPSSPSYGLVIAREVPPPSS